MRAFLAELRRRNVHRTTIAYLATGWLIIEVLQNLLPIFDAPTWLNQAIVLILIAGLPLAIWLSWAFEFTGEGIKRSADVVPGDSIAERSGRIVDFVIIGILLAAVVLLLSDRFIGRSAPALVDATDVASIAVLPFDDFSESRDQRHLAIGITDTLLNALAQVDGLKVIARTSVLPYEGERPSIATIGEQLGVGAVLEGSVQRHGDRLRITAQLIRVSDESHLWSRAFDMTMGDIFAIQDNIANAVATALRPGEMQDRRLDTGETSVEAYEHFVRGRDLWRERDPATVLAAVEELETATQLDPDFAPAYAELALAYWFSAHKGRRKLDEVRLLIESNAERALELDETEAWAWAAKAFLARSKNDLEAAERHYRKAIELDPNESYFYQWLSLILAGDLRRLDEVKVMRRRAYELDPRNLFILSNYALFLAWVGDEEGALEMHRRAGEIDPEGLMGYMNRTQTHRHFGDYDDAIRVVLPLIEAHGLSWRAAFDIATAFLALGDQEAASAWFAEAQSLREDRLEYSPAWFLRPEDHGRLVAEMREAAIRDDNLFRHAYVAMAYTVVGDFERARSILVELIEEEGVNEDSGLRYEWPLFLRLVVAKNLGEQVVIDRILPKLRSYVMLAHDQGWQMQRTWRNLARLAAIEGDREAVIGYLRRAADHGYMGLRTLKYWDALWGPYHDDPEFQAIVADIEARQREQRASLYAEGIRFPPGFSNGSQSEAE